jgi:hypothetical protein
MEPPETAAPFEWVVTNEAAEELSEGGMLPVGFAYDAAALAVLGARGSVSNDKARRQHARSRENDVAAVGSWVDV